MENTTEQAEPQEGQASEFGKFADAKELLNAYNALEREFTKRCQLVTQLRGELASRTDAQEKSDSRTEPAPAVEQIREQTAEQKLPDDIAARAADYADALSEVPQVMDACIERYKKKLIASCCVCPPEGMAVIVPAKRPKTLADAKRIADGLLS